MLLENDITKGGENLKFAQGTNKQTEKKNKYKKTLIRRNELTLCKCHQYVRVCINMYHIEHKKT